jgi:hypothetical protein
VGGWAFDSASACALERQAQASQPADDRPEPAATKAGLGVRASNQSSALPRLALCEIASTLAPELALHCSGARAQSVDQAAQRRHLSKSERGSAGRRSDNHIRCDGICPARRQRMLRAIIVEEENPILRLGLANRQHHELPAVPRMERMERMGHPDRTAIIIGIGSS